MQTENCFGVDMSKARINKALKEEDKLIKKTKTKPEQDLLNNIIESVPDSIYFKDLNSKFVKTNKANAIKLGFSNPEDLIGKTDFDIFDKENAAGAFKDEQEIIRTGKPYISTEKKEVWKDGKVTWAISHKMPTYDSEGNVIGTFGFTRDITEKKKAEIVREALLRISEAAYTTSDMNTLYQRIHEVIVTLMPARNIYIAIYDEKEGVISFPYYVDEFDPSPVQRKPLKGMTEYIMRIDKAVLIDEKTLAELNSIGQIEVVGTKPKIFLGAPLKVGGRTIGVIIVQDYENERAYGEDERQFLIFVTEQIAQVIERKMNSEAIMKYAEELKQLNNTKDKFFSIIAHDLRGPFNSLLGLSEFLVSPDEDLTEAQRNEFIQEIYNLLKNEYELLQNLLQWAAMQLDKVEYKQTKINLFELVSKKMDLLSVQAHNKNIAIVNNVKMDCFVLADNNMLGSIVQNFITNAIKFTNNNGTINVNSTLENELVIVTIEDNGIGMSKERVEEIFRLDSTKSSTGTAGERGTGLGVILCKEMIEKQGGKLTISSEPNVGTKVIFSIPISTEDF